MQSKETFISRFETAFGPWVIKWHWVIIVVSILITVIATSGVRFLTVNNDTRVFFSEENPQLQALEALENTYNRINNVLFVIAPKNGNVFTGKGYQLYADKYWMPDETNMVNHQNGKSTRLQVSNYQFGVGLKDDDFNKNALKRAK